MSSELASLVVHHPDLGTIIPEKVLGVGGTAVVVRGRTASGRTVAAKLGRRTPLVGPGCVSAFSWSSRQPGLQLKPLNDVLIDAALLAEHQRLEQEGDRFRLLSHGLGHWEDVVLGRWRPALVMEEIEGRSLLAFSRQDWHEDAWLVLEDVLTMIDASPSGERRPHGDLKASNVIVGQDNRTHLIDPGVVLHGSLLNNNRHFDLWEAGIEEWWAPEETIVLTTPTAYPAYRPGTAGADLMAIGLMTYAGLTGKTPLEGNPELVLDRYCFSETYGAPQAANPRVLVENIPPPRELAPETTWQMEDVILRLLCAPLGPALQRGEGQNLGHWVTLCQSAAESVE